MSMNKTNGEIRKNFTLNTGVRELSYIPFINTSVFRILASIENNWSQVQLQHAILLQQKALYESILKSLEANPKKIHINLISEEKIPSIPPHPRDVSDCRKAIKECKESILDLTEETNLLYIKVLTKLCENIFHLVEEPLIENVAVFIGETQSMSQTIHDPSFPFDLCSKELLHPSNTKKYLGQKIASVVAYHVFMYGNTKKIALHS